MKTRDLVGAALLLLTLAALSAGPASATTPTITIATDQPSYVQGQTATVSGSENTVNNVIIYISSPSTPTVLTYPLIGGISLKCGGTIFDQTPPCTYAIKWDTAFSPVGTYTLTAYSGYTYTGTFPPTQSEITSYQATASTTANVT